MKNSESFQFSILPYCRVFAREIQQTDLVVRINGSGHDDLITPSGYRISQLFTCGALTEISRGANGVGYVRIADPTGVLVLYLKPGSPEIVKTLDSLTTPAFVSVIASVERDNNTGESGYRLLLEMIAPSDRLSRDRWILRTAHLTLIRLERLLSVIFGESANDEEKRALSRYGTNTRHLQELGGVIQKALEQVQGAGENEPDRAEPDRTNQMEDTAELIMRLIRQHSGPRGISLLELTGFAGKSGIAEPHLIETIRCLISEDEIYQPSSGFVKIL